VSNFSSAKKKAVYKIIVAIGKKFRLESDFEKRMLWNWISGTGFSYRLTYNEFHEIDNGGVFSYVGTRGSGYVYSVDTYNLPKYDFAIGGATVYTNSQFISTGFYDRYDFNKGNRSLVAEVVTRIGGAIESQTGAKPFDIIYP